MHCALKIITNEGFGLCCFRIIWSLFFLSLSHGRDGTVSPTVSTSGRLLYQLHCYTKGFCSVWISLKCKKRVKSFCIRGPKSIQTIRIILHSFNSTSAFTLLCQLEVVTDSWQECRSTMRTMLVTMSFLLCKSSKGWQQSWRQRWSWISKLLIMHPSFQTRFLQSIFELIFQFPIPGAGPQLA